MKKIKVSQVKKRIIKNRTILTNVDNNIKGEITIESAHDVKGHKISMSGDNQLVRV